MSKQVYEEALADVKKLKEVAEDNAKRAILEAVTPRIKDLIENELLGESPVDDEDKLLFDENPVNVAAVGGQDEMAADAISMPDEEGKVTLDLSKLTVPSSDGGFELSTEALSKLGTMLSGNETKLASTVNSLVEATRRLAGGKVSAKVHELQSIISNVENTYAYLQESLSTSPNKKKYEDLLEGCFKTLTKLTEQSKMNKSRLNEEDLTFTIKGLDVDPDQLEDLSIDIESGGGDEEGDEEEGGDDELDLGGDEGGEEGDEEEGGDDELDLDLGGDEDEEGGDEEETTEEGDYMESRRLNNNTIVEIDEGMLRREISRMKALREESSKPPQIKGLKAHGPGKVADGFEDDDLGDPFVDIDLRESDDMKEADLESEGDDMKEADLESESDDMKEADLESEGDLDEYAVEEADDVAQYGGRVGRPAEQMNHQARQPGMSETIRRRLAAEAKLQLEAKKKAKQAKQKGQQAEQQQKKAKTQKGKQVAAQMKKQMKEAYAFYARRFNESVARSNKLKGVLAEAARKGRVDNDRSTALAEGASSLRKELAETNLFNAKLLYANKVLQNESLTKRQKAQVIERLDEATNEREAKLMYESLTKTLQAAPRPMTEAASRVIGSSSRAERPASTLTEGFEADRWARLAGIVK